MKILNIYRAILVFIILSVTLLTYCSREDNISVARVGGRKITFNEFEKEFTRGKNAKMIQQSSLEDKIKFLDGMINKQLKIIDAYHHELDKDENIVGQIKERSRGFMFNRLLELEITQKVIPESAIKDFFEKSNKEVKIKQILVKFNPNIPEQKQNALTRAREIVKRIKAKEDFSRLAEDVSDDMNTAKKGGDKGYLKWGPRSFENPVYATAFSMKENQVSKPIETQNGYYIIKVVEIKHYPASSYEHERDRIREQLYKVRNQDLMSAYYEYLDSLRSKYEVRFDDKGVGLFFKRYSMPVRRPANNQNDSLNVIPKETTPLDNFSDGEKQIMVAAFEDGKLTINDLVEDIKKYPRHQRPRFQNKSEVQDFINVRIIPVYLLEREATAKNIQQDQIVKKHVTSFQERTMLDEIQRIQVNDKLGITEDSLKSYFEKHREEYQHPGKREIQQIYVEDENLAGNIVIRARRGEDFARLFRRYNEKEAFKNNEGISQITKGRTGIGKSSFELNIGEISDPIKVGQGFQIIKLLKIIDPVLKTFDEAKSQVNGKVRRIAFDNREKEWIDELRGRINFVIYKKNLDRTLRTGDPNYSETK